MIFSTALPGTYKLLSLLIFSHLNGMDSAGEFSNDLAMVFSTTLLLSNGWCAWLLSYLPKSSDIARRHNCFSKAFYGQVLFFIPGIVFLYFTYKINVISNFLFSTILLISFSIYQINRHYNLSLTFYRKQFIVELLIFTLMIFISCVAKNANELLFYSSLVYFIVSLDVFFHLKTKIPSKNDFKFSIYSGFSNYLSGGILSLIIPVANFTGGSLVAGYCALVTQFVSLSMYIPRNLSVYFMPRLSRVFEDKTKLLTIYSKFTTLNGLSLLIMSVLFLLFFTVDYILTMQYVKNYFLLQIAILIVFTYLASQLSLPSSNVLLSLEMPDVILKTNIIFSSGVLLLSIVLYVTHINRLIGNETFLILFLINLFVFQLIKLHLQSKRLKRQLQ
ncbi:membrane hypothetical protein [Vibrio chagasii]|nr:membrane hypothetical protein [Vibrio chagasii]